MAENSPTSLERRRKLGVVVSETAGLAVFLTISFVVFTGVTWMNNHGLFTLSGWQRLLSGQG